MVNYCCVFGCGRNSRTSKQLYFYSIPRDPRRQEQWLESAGRPDLLAKPISKRTFYRFCSRHFTPASFKNKHLCMDAVPTLHLPGSAIEEPVEDPVDEIQRHVNISCNNCGNSITGYRYKCMSCPGYDLCSRCEMIETHPYHFMLRIPAPIQFKKIENVIKKWQEYFNETEKTEDSSDDEPITKYAKNYDSGVDLTEDVKQSIRDEVARVLALKTVTTNKKKKTVSRKKPLKTDDAQKSSKTQKIESVDLTALFSNAPAMVFEDVNEVHSIGGNQESSVKNELPVIFDNNIEPELPMMQIKLSEDLSELMMEVTEQKSMF